MRSSRLARNFLGQKRSAHVHTKVSDVGQTQTWQTWQNVTHQEILECEFYCLKIETNIFLRPFWMMVMLFLSGGKKNEKMQVESGWKSGKERAERENIFINHHSRKRGGGRKEKKFLFLGGERVKVEGCENRWTYS